MNKDLRSLANFLFEVGNLNRTPRSGLFFVGSVAQSVSEHVHRVVWTGFVLATMEKEANLEKVLKMCLFHDLAEARTSDLNYVHQKYVTADDKKALADMAATVPFGDDILELVEEYEKRESLESKLAKDADNIEWILSLKEQSDIGNTRTGHMIIPAVKRIKTEAGKALIAEILETNSDEWYFGDKDDEWWVSRNK